MIDTVAEQVEPAPERVPPPGRDGAVRVAGAAVATGLGGVSAVYEAFLTPLMWHHMRVPAAVVLAVLGNAALVWFTREVTGRLVAVLLPAVAWIVVIVLAAGQTTERDLLLTSNNWVALGTMFAGALAFAVPVAWFANRALLRFPVPKR